MPVRLPRQDNISIAVDIEENIRDYVSSFRKNIKKETQFDRNIEIVLSQALCN